jgi:lipoprotein NlpD
MRISKGLFILIALALVGLSGCETNVAGYRPNDPYFSGNHVSKPPARVASSSKPKKKVYSSSSTSSKKTVSGGDVVVQPGDTLFAISFREGVDHRALAQRNNISDPDTIYVGQRLKLPDKNEKVSYKPRPSPKNTPKTTPKAINKVQKNSDENDFVIGDSVSKTNWVWPAKGRIIEKFKPSVSSDSVANKGIDIEGDLGDPVVSAASGQVVYAGQGFVGYGNLLIVKHDALHLTAYAHNRKMLVKEGDKVKAGQKIAEIGSTGTSSPRLHFEVRRKGKPIDPLGVLPSR